MTHSEPPIPRALREARERITPILREASGWLEPSVRRVVDYHWGFCDAQGRPDETRAGKALRPALVLLSAEAIGLATECALPAAAAVEIVHDFTLLHDDVMDEDDVRRGRPAAWTEFGVGAAICGGDALMLLAIELLLRHESPHRQTALRELMEATQAVIAGQMLDLGFEGRTDIGLTDYLDMAARKTGALLAASASLGALLGGAESDVVKALRRFGTGLGLAFQAADDWLGIWGDPKRVGKPAASDLRQRKASLPIVLALASATPAGEAIRGWMRRRGPIDETELSRAVDCLASVGAERETRARARLELDRALEALGSAPITPSAREQLTQLAHFVVERGF